MNSIEITRSHFSIRTGAILLFLFLSIGGCSSGDDAVSPSDTITGIYYCVADSGSVIPNFILHVQSDHDTLWVTYIAPITMIQLTSRQNEAWYHPQRVYGFHGSRDRISVMLEFWRESDGIIAGWTVYQETGITPPSQTMFKGCRAQ